jgi:hypothetical protein
MGKIQILNNYYNEFQYRVCNPVQYRTELTSSASAVRMTGPSVLGKGPEEFYDSVVVTQHQTEDS